MIDFLAFIEASSTLVWTPAAHNRRWGLICSCEEHVKDRREGVKHIHCAWNSRRLPDAGDYITTTVEEAKEFERKLVPGQCGNDQRVVKAIRTLLQVKRSAAMLRGKHFNLVPWAFAKAWSVEGAENCWQQVMSRPIEEHGVLVQDFMQRCGADLDARRKGGDLTEKLRAELALWDLMPLCEDVGEGYHRATNAELHRATGSSMNHLKAEVRRDQELARISKWAAFGDEGKMVIRFEWRLWKRILQTAFKTRFLPKRMAATAALHRIYHDDDLSAQDWSTILNLEQPTRPVVSEDADNLTQLQTEYLAGTLVKNNFYAVPKPAEVVEEDGRRVQRDEVEFFQVLNITSAHSRPKVMHTFASADDVALYARLALEVQPYTRVMLAAAGVGAHADLENAEVYVEADSYWVSALSLAPF